MWYEFKLIFRKIKNSKLFPIINITGLTVALTCSILAFLFIQDEISYDKHFKETDNVYRLTGNHFGGTDFGFGNPARFIDNILSDIPEIESGIRLCREKGNLKVLEHNFNLENHLYSDSDFFSFFGLELLLGDPHKVLSAPNMTVISESKAKEWFGDVDPIGETIKLDNSIDLTITGIYKDFPEQSHIQSHIITAFSTLKIRKHGMFTQWGWFSSAIYLKTDDNSDISKVNLKIKNLWNNVCDESHQGEHIQMILQPFSNIHLRSAYMEDGVNKIGIVYGIGALALFILIIACFNFINLSIALNSKKNVETGIKKSLGASRTDFSKQVFIEVSLYLSIALIVSSFVVSYFIQYISHFLDKNLSFSPFNNIPLLIFIALIGIILVLGTGIFPLLNMLNVETAGILKSVNMSSRKKKSGFAFQSILSNVLVVIQFTFSIMLILSAIIVNIQLKLIRQKDCGFDREQVMVINNSVQTVDHFNYFKQKLEQFPEVSLVTSANYVPTDGIENWGSPKVVGEEWRETNNCGNLSVNYGHFDAIGAEFIMGRNFIKDKVTEEEKLIITETLMNKLGLKNPIGKYLTNLRGGINREIIGVVKDIEYQTIHNKRNPIIFFCRSKDLGWHQKIIIKLQSPDLSKSIANIEKEWIKATPDWPIDYFFLDEKFEANYNTEKKIGKVVNVLTWIAIFLCSLGLFGLALYNINGRIKEIGVRKVHGAKVAEIMVLLNKEFVARVLTAFIIAVPLCLIFMNKWLESFAYKTALSWWIFALAGMLALGIALLTVSFQSYKAATRNPVEALRYE